MTISMHLGIISAPFMQLNGGNGKGIMGGMMHCEHTGKPADLNGRNSNKDMIELMHIHKTWQPSWTANLTFANA